MENKAIEQKNPQAEREAVCGGGGGSSSSSISELRKTTQWRYQQRLDTDKDPYEIFAAVH